jgi:sulfoxide reductase heme-binding subunit YedZ
MFFMALIHGVVSIIQFHTLGDTFPIQSIFLSNTHFDSLVNFPFQTLGFCALIILFLMAATSHDFWLHNLSPKVWKGLHMMVYVAYALLVMHVMLGVIQLESSPVNVAVLGGGMALVIGLHLAAALKEFRRDRTTARLEGEFVKVCELQEIAENRAKMITIGDDKIAVFKYDGKLSAVANACKHQNGPLGEGKIVDGCITCPWHGYQYLPHNGQSPPPFEEKVATYDLKLEGTTIYVNPNPHPEGAAVEPITI